MLYDPCVVHLPRIKIYFYLLSTCTELLISARKLITFFPYPPLGCENFPFESNPLPYPEYLYLSISPFFLNLTAPNRPFSGVAFFVLVVKEINS